jgi:hypothetical protein
MRCPPALKLEAVLIYAALGLRVRTFLFVGNAKVISGCRDAAAKQAVSRK